MTDHHKSLSLSYLIQLPTRTLYMAAATDQVRGGVNHLLVSWGDAAGLIRLANTNLEVRKRLLIRNWPS